MILVIDVGNTNVTMGVFEKDELKGKFRITTRIPRTSDEYGLLILELLHTRGIEKNQVEAVVVATVVPKVMYSLTNGIIKYLDCKPFVVGAGTRTGIRITNANPREVGTDRIVDAAAAIELYGGPVIVVDFGTATTYDLILKDGTFAAGITSPGIRISANALCSDTAKLPEVEIAKPASILANDTISSIQAGLVFGCIGQTEYIIRRIKEEAKIPEAKVVATGGLGKIIAGETNEIQEYNPDLTLHGLRLIYERCRSNR